MSDLILINSLSSVAIRESRYVCVLYNYINSVGRYIAVTGVVGGSGDGDGGSITAR